MLTPLVQAYAQGVPRYAYFDDNQTKLKEIYHVRDTLANVLEGLYMSYYENGNIEAKGQFVNNETAGIWEFYFENQKLKMRGELEKNQNKGYWEYNYENGAKSMEGQIIEQLREEEWRFYYESSELQSVGHFKGGLRHGLWVDYYEDGIKRGQIDYMSDSGVYEAYYRSGAIKSRGKKRSGKHYGQWQYFYDNDSIQAEGKFVDGKKSGEWAYYHQGGALSATGSFDLDQASGQWHYLYPNGQTQSKGDYKAGYKDGDWRLYYPDGALKGEGNYDFGNGQYKEYYPSGAIKSQGMVVKGRNQGEWVYYSENGPVQGRCIFNKGSGLYTGYYPSGEKKIQGKIENDERVGVWEIFHQDGELAGYYRPFYEEQPDIVAKEKEDQGVGEYRFKKKNFNYFESKVNEFEGIILSANPAFAFVGALPVSLELYYQERLGYELEFQLLRDPFLGDTDDIAIDDLYRRGYSAALRQKFYNADGQFGMWYFGHQLMYTQLDHFANILGPGRIRTVSADEQRFEYMLFLGYRLMPRTAESGFTADLYWGFGAGYREFQSNTNNDRIFSELSQSSVSFPFKLVLNIGYVIPARRRR